jgi:hypothetical protein
MEVRNGIRGEFGSDPFDIILDETDLQRLKYEYGRLLGDPEAMGNLEEMPTWVAMLLLTLEAERFVLVQAPKYGRPVEDSVNAAGLTVPGIRSQIHANREQFATALATATGLTLEETRKVVLP